MLEGVLDLPATKIREVMTPRTAMISMQEDDQLLDILHVLVESAHSRFPVSQLTSLIMLLVFYWQKIYYHFD